jgi:hypothetical protein
MSAALRDPHAITGDIAEGNTASFMQAVMRQLDV